MLNLTRYVGQEIIIGHDIVIKVLNVKGKQVTIGIDAPKNVQVHRREIYERILAEEKE